MNKTVVIAVGAAIVGALAVIAYNALVTALPPPGVRAGPCAGSNPHCIDVNVITVGGQAQIALIPDHKVNNNGVDIDWAIATQGYTFPANGITFVNKPGMPLPAANEFSCSLFNSTTFRCKDTHHTMGTFGYTVTLSGSPAAPPLDPYILNH
jgi:hypothetical protein